MTRIIRLFLILTVIGPLHMGEQLLTGLEEFSMIQEKAGAYYAWFGAAHADSASVVLITIVWTLVSVLFYTLLVGGTARLATLGLFGVFAVTELHHVVDALQKGGYDPGLVTCVPYAMAGWALVAEVARQYRQRRQNPAEPTLGAALRV